MPEGFMSPEQRLQALEQLEQRQQRSQGRVIRAVWSSIILAAVVLATLIGFATWQLAAVRQEVHSLSDQRESLNRQIADLGKQIDDLGKRRQEAEQQLRAATGALANLPEADVKKAIDQQFAKAPQTAALLPRIYMQIVDRADSTRAQTVRTALQAAGYLVLGIEYVPTAAALRTTDVRFYHSTERAEAEKIAQVIKNAGEANVSVNYLRQFENTTSARPNHFEVWLAHVPE